MAKKRSDHNDSTMDISASQLVPGPGQRPPVPHQPGVRPGDQSMWIGGVVGADDFVQRPKAKGNRRGLAIGLAAMVTVGAAAGGYYVYSAPDKPMTSAAAKPEPVKSPEPAKPVVVTAVADAGVEAPAAKPDAGVATELKVDAVSAAGELVKKEPAKKTTKKKVVKKPVPKKAPKKK